MSGIGPELPPHLLAKRKRKQEEETNDAPTTASGAKRAPSPGEGEKRRRVVGPAMPPTPLDERPSEPPNSALDSDSDDDDGFGPSLPPDGTDGALDQDDNDNTTSTSAAAPSEDKLQRDEWMMMPPKQDDLAARLDPTRQRPRTFNTGKGARGPSTAADDRSTWNETPEQKRKRLADEMMGISKPSSVGPQKPASTSNARKDEAAAQKIREHTEKTRGPSLIDQHKREKGAEAEDDDPSKRSFDREKDMGAGMRIGDTQRQQMLSKASDFSSKFSGGSYL
ncbi:hypothetical protein LTR37_007622 [Vermiconidia calcicola]|uniref:Uncharacterized protein n=1 Tax=Vermiconidia calcicola TaxID=1690605 RepID=A0ACC3ND78_9PEZI|nr:hypothetical protein LTR37_007622 [Vermiconidia calcicola]